MSKLNILPILNSHLFSVFSLAASYCITHYYSLQLWFIILQLERKSGETHLAGHSVRAQLAKTKRWLNPPQQRHHIEVLYPSPRTNTRLLPNIHSQKIHPVLLVLFPPNKLYQRNDVTYFASGSYSDHILLNSSKWWGPRIDQSRVK